MPDQRERVQLAFDRNRWSVSDDRTIAHVSRNQVIQAVEAELLDPGVALLVRGFIGVGKSSAFQEALRNVLRVYQHRLGYAQVRTLRSTDFADGFLNAFRRGFPELSAGGLEPSAARQDGILLADLVTAMDAARALVVCEDAQRLEPEVWARLTDLSKAIAEPGRVRAKLVLIASRPGGAEKNFASTFLRPSINEVLVSPWTDWDLRRIVVDGSQKCGLEVKSDVVSRVAAFSCGIPAAVHLFAREVCLEAVRHRSRAATMAQCALVLGNVGQLEKLAQRLLPEVPYLEEWRRFNDALVPAVVALLGRLRSPVELSQISALFPGHPSDREILRALEQAASVKSAVRCQRDRYEVDELVASSTAMLALQAMALRRSKVSDEASRFLNVLLCLEQDQDGPAKSISDGAADMEAETLVPWMPVIVEATKFVFNEVSRWIGKVREETADANAASNEEGETGLRVEPKEFDRLEADPRLLLQNVDADLAQTQQYIVRATLKSVKADLEIRSDIKASLAEIVDQNSISAIELRRRLRERSRLLLEHTQDLVDLLNQIYQK